MKKKKLKWGCKQSLQVSAKQGKPFINDELLNYVWLEQPNKCV